MWAFPTAQLVRISINDLNVDDDLQTIYLQVRPYTPQKENFNNRYPNELVKKSLEIGNESIKLKV